MIYEARCFVNYRFEKYCIFFEFWAVRIKIFNVQNLIHGIGNVSG